MLKPFMVIAIVLILVLLVSEAFLGQFSSLRLIGTRGNLYSPPNIGIYQDSNGTNPVSYIDWGSVEPGLTKNMTIYICNEGKGKVNLSLNTTGWNPSNISSYMALTWSYNGSPLFPTEIIQVTFSLSSSSSPEFIRYLVAYDVKEFSFNIVINAFS